jgi:hypothetical protein
MYSIPQQAVINGYWNRENFLPHPSIELSVVVTNPPFMMPFL